AHAVEHGVEGVAEDLLLDVLLDLRVLPLDVEHDLEAVVDRLRLLERGALRGQGRVHPRGPAVQHDGAGLDRDLDVGPLVSVWPRWAGRSRSSTFSWMAASPGNGARATRKGRPATSAGNGRPRRTMAFMTFDICHGSLTGPFAPGMDPRRSLASHLPAGVRS